MPTQADFIALAANRNAASLIPPIDWVPAVLHATNYLATPVRQLRANSAGTIIVELAGSKGTARTLNFLAGETRSGLFIALRTGGSITAGNIECGL